MATKSTEWTKAEAENDLLKKAEVKVSAAFDAFDAAWDKALLDIGKGAMATSIVAMEKARQDFMNAVRDARDQLSKCETANKKFERWLKDQAKGGGTKASEPKKAAKTELKAYTFPNDADFDPDKVKVVSASIGGSTGAKLVEIGGHKYIMKTDTNVSKEHVLNEAAADKMYRAAGVRVPDCKTYTSGGKTYKLAEFIEGGTSLGDYWSKATPKQKTEMRQKLLKGYLVDAALGNWDNVGMSMDNILIDKDGEPWRIDNGSAMGYRAQGAAKKPEDWKKAEMPDDWMTLKTSANNKKIFGDATTYDIFSQDTDLDAVVDAAPPAEKAIVKKRVEELKQMQARCRDFDVGGYAHGEQKGGYDAVSKMLDASYQFSKDGMRERLQFKVESKPGAADDYTETYLYSRSGNKPPPEPQKPTGSLEAAEAVVKAAVSINRHNDKGDYKANDASVQAALDWEPKLKAIVKANPKDKSLKELLANIDEIKKSKANGYKTKVGQVMMTTTPPTQEEIDQWQKDHDAWEKKMQSAPSSSKYQSLTDEVWHAIEDAGGNKEFIKQWAGSQAGDSWDDNACRQKIVELCMMGKIDPTKKLNFKDFEKVDGFFIKSNFSLTSAIDNYNNGRNNLEKDIIAMEKWKAAQMEFLENADIEGIDKKRRALFLIRTESKDNVVKRYGLKENEAKEYRTGANESFAHGKVTSIGPEEMVAGYVPFSRITNNFMMERTPGGRDNMLHSRREAEFTVNPLGLKLWYCGKCQSLNHEEYTRVRKLVDDLEKTKK